MSGLFDTSFDLLVGFGSAHIMIVGILGGLIGAMVSAIVWMSRGRIVQALPGIALVLLVPAMVIGIIPGLESLAVPVALALLVLTFLSHLRRSEGRTLVDTVLAVTLGLALLAFIIVQILSLLSGPTGS